MKNIIKIQCRNILRKVKENIKVRKIYKKHLFAFLCLQQIFTQRDVSICLYILFYEHFMPVYALPYTQTVEEFLEWYNTIPLETLLF